MHWEFTSGRCGPTGTHCAMPPSSSGIDAASLDTDIQNAEVDYSDGQPYISYWVDRSLSSTFAPTTPAGPTLLSVTTSESNVAASGSGGASIPSVDLLATQNDDGSVAVMVVDIAPESSTVVDGNGCPRTVVVDVSGLLSGATSIASRFSTMSAVTIDATTDLLSGPSPADLAVPSSGRIPVTLDGYGVTFLTLGL